LENPVQETERVITATGQLSVEWFEAVLRESGALTGGSVAAFEVIPLKSDNSHAVRIRLDYSPDSGGERPAHLFLKLCGGDNSHAFGPSEVEYYRQDYPGLTGDPLLKCYSAVYSPEKASYHLLLEDLSATHGPAWDKTGEGDYIYPVVEGMAKLHAYWWPGPTATPGYPVAPQLAKFLDHMQGGPALLVEELRGEMDTATLATALLIAEKLPARLYARAQAPNGLTLVHGDLNPGNILTPRPGFSGKTYLIDRQPFDWSLTTWLAVSDLAYTVVLWWEPEVRRRHEEKFLAAYHAALVANGVTGYPMAQLRLDYRLCAMQCLYIPFEWCLLESDRKNMDWVWKPEFRRVMAAVQDLNCLDLL
jgi:hypothetical protein